MNVTRIQQDVIKDVLAGKADKWFIQCTDTDIIIATAHQLYMLDPKYFLLDEVALIEGGVRDLTSFNKILNGSDESHPAVKTGVMREVKVSAGKMCTALELKVDDELIYIDQALLKYYDKSAEFEGTNGHSPVYIYEDDILVGVVLPVKVA